MTLDHVRDLYRHLRWADETVWGAILDSDACTSDESILDTMHHLHATQHAFLDVWTRREFTFHRRDGEGAEAIRTWAGEFHDGVDAYLASLSGAELDETLPIPWAKYFEEHLGRPPGRVTHGESIFQVVSHSTHHRGQVTRRIRELGSEPPLVDYIVWLWLERPEPAGG